MTIRKFLYKTLLFLLPIGLVLLPPYIMLKRSGENFTEINEVVVNNEKCLIGYAYNESNYKYLKWYALQKRGQYDIVALGASRVLQFREEMFDRSFYNAGFAINSMSDFLPFLQSLPEDKLPKVLILSVDQFMFNVHSDDLKNEKGKDFWKHSFSKYPSGNTYKQFYSDLLSGKLAGAKSNYPDKIKRIGLNAAINSKGYRRDGSLAYGSQIVKLLNNDPTAVDYQLKESFVKIEQGIKGFEHGEKANPKAYVVMEKLLTFCKKKNIYVVGFLPPFADAVYEGMQKSSDYHYMDGLYEAAKPLFDEQGFELFNYPTVSSCHSDDSEVIDGIHPGEVSYHKLLIDMIRNGSKLGDMTDVNRLEFDLEKKINRFTVYEYRN